MYLILKKGVLRKVLSKAIVKAGNIRNLAIDIEISRSSISRYYNEKVSIKREDLGKVLNYLGISINETEIIKQLPINWRQIKGGKRCVEVKKEKGIFEKQLKQCQKKSSIHMKSWHKKMKKNYPEKYYSMQYEKFKKVAGYKFVTSNGEKVRNNFEKKIADLLKKFDFDYKYESLVKAGNKYFFPDFLIKNNIIIECTAWRGFDKAIKLKNKIKYLKKEYKVYVVIPKALKRYYEILNHHLLLGIDDLIEVIKKSG
jgi:hypothetical protein